MMDAAEGAGVEPPAPSDHEWAHAGTDRVEMLQVHPGPQVQVGHLHLGLLQGPSPSTLSGFSLAKLFFFD